MSSEQNNTVAASADAQPSDVKPKRVKKVSEDGTVDFKSSIKKLSEARMDGENPNLSKKAKVALNEWLNKTGREFVEQIVNNTPIKTITTSTVSDSVSNYFKEEMINAIHAGINATVKAWTAKSEEHKQQLKEKSATEPKESESAADSTETKRVSKTALADLHLPVPKVTQWLKSSNKRVAETAHIMTTAALEYWMVMILKEAYEHAQSKKRKGINADDVHVVASKYNTELKSEPEHTPEEVKESEARKEAARLRAKERDALKRAEKQKESGAETSPKKKAKEESKPKKKKAAADTEEKEENPSKTSKKRKVKEESEEVAEPAPKRGKKKAAAAASDSEPAPAPKRGRKKKCAAEEEEATDGDMQE